MFRKAIMTVLAVSMIFPMGVSAAEHPTGLGTAPRVTDLGALNDSYYPTGGLSAIPEVEYGGDIEVNDNADIKAKEQADMKAEAEYLVQLNMAINEYNECITRAIQDAYYVQMQEENNKQQYSPSEKADESLPAENVKSNVNTNIDCILTKEMAPMLFDSLKAAEASYGAVGIGETIQINTKTKKLFEYPINGADGVIKISEGGTFTFIPNTKEDKSSLVIEIDGDGAYTPVVFK